MDKKKDAVKDTKKTKAEKEIAKIEEKIEKYKVIRNAVIIVSAIIIIIISCTYNVDDDPMGFKAFFIYVRFVFFYIPFFAIYKILISKQTNKLEELKANLSNDTEIIKRISKKEK